MARSATPIVRAMAIVMTAALASISSTASAAQVTFTITAGSAADGGVVHWTADTVPQTAGPLDGYKNPNFIRSNDEQPDLFVICNSSHAEGAVTTGSQDGDRVIQIDAITWERCSGWHELRVEAVNLPWEVDVFDATAGGVRGEITGFDVWMYDTATDGEACTIHVTGTVDIRYGNTSTELDASESQNTLTIEHVSGDFGCTAVHHEGWTTPYHANYDITADDPAEDPIAITQD